MTLKKFYPHLFALAAFAALVVYASNLLSKISQDYTDQNRQLEKLADERAKKIAKTLEEERKKHAQILIRMQEEYERNREEYERKIKELEEKKKRDVSSFVENHGDDPLGMAVSLSKSTGFKIYSER